jgi:hypothetical protein
MQGRWIEQRPAYAPGFWVQRGPRWGFGPDRWEEHRREERWEHHHHDHDRR